MQKAKSFVFADYQGLTVAMADELRKKMRESNVDYMVAKKTLISKAVQEAGYEVDTKSLPGMLSVAFGMEDEIAPARALGEMAKTTPVKLVAGVFEGEFADQAKVTALSLLPSKKELLGQVVGTIYAPVSAFVRVLNAIRAAKEPTA